MSVQNQKSLPTPSGKPQSFRDHLGLRLGRTDQDFQHLVDFVVPILAHDMLQGMYLTMALARRHPNPLVRDIYASVRAYLERIRDLLVAARAGGQLAEREVKSMISLPEAHEIGMGYTRDGYSGTGLGTGAMVDAVYNELLSNPELAEMAVEEPDVLTFVPGISLDRMSDLIATVAKIALIRYTQETARRYRFDGKLVTRVVNNTWNHTAHRLGRATAAVLEFNDRALLLVPKNIVRSSPPLRTEQYAAFIGATIMTKAQVLVDIKAHPGRLKKFVDEVLADEWRFRSRRAFRD